MLTPESYRAAIAEAHRLGLKTIGHVKTLAEVKDMVRAGLDARRTRSVTCQSTMNSSRCSRSGRSFRTSRH